MTTDLERGAREAVRPYVANRLLGHEKVYGTKMSMAQEDNCCTDFRTGYLAAATLREKEIEELRQKLDTARRAIDAYVADEDDFSAEIATLQARVAELEGMVPKWYTIREWNERFNKGFDREYVPKFFNGPSLWLMCPVPPIPVPETKA